MNDLISQTPNEVKQKDIDAFKKLKKRFGCTLCGKIFKAGDTKRWVYANDSGVGCGNFFVCGNCDGEDVLERGIADFKKMQEAVKRWQWYEG